MSPIPSLTKTYHRDTYPAISPTKPSLNQSGKTVLITGGGAGIGFEIARSFAKASASRIIIVGRRGGLLDEAAAKLKEEFSSTKTEFIARQADIADDSSMDALWQFLTSEKVLVDVLVLNAASYHPGATTLNLEKKIIMDMFNVNVGGNFAMTSKFVQQSLRPAGKQLNVVNISSAAIQMYPFPGMNTFASSKAAFLALLGRIALEHPVEDVQIVSFHPGILFSEAASKNLAKDAFKWDEMALPADSAVWAASPEASLFHGRYLWAHWDVDELRADEEILKRLKNESDFLRVGIHGVNTITFESLPFEDLASQ